MGAIHVENVDERVIRSIRLRARLHNRSFEEEVRSLLSESTANRMSREEFLAEARRIQDMTPTDVEQTDSADIIRELRDNGYAGR